MKCSACGDVKEPPIVEGKQLQYPVGWAQVQVTNSRIHNVIICDKDAKTLHNFLKLR